MRNLLESIWVYHWAFWVIDYSFHRHGIGASRMAADRHVEAGSLRGEHDTTRLASDKSCEASNCKAVPISIVRLEN